MSILARFLLAMLGALPLLTTACGDEIELTLDRPSSRTFLFACVARDGDRQGGVTFQEDAFEAMRLEAAKRGEVWQPDGFRWVPMRPTRTPDESEPEFAGRLSAYETTRQSTPHELEGRWLILDAMIEGGAFTEKDIVTATVVKRWGRGRRVVLRVKKSSQEALRESTRRWLGRLVVAAWDDQAVIVATVEEAFEDAIEIPTDGPPMSEGDVAWLMSCFPRD